MPSVLSFPTIAKHFSHNTYKNGIGQEEITKEDTCLTQAKNFRSFIDSIQAKFPKFCQRVNFFAIKKLAIILIPFIALPFQKWYFNSIFFCDMLSILHLSMPYLTVQLKFIKHPFFLHPSQASLNTPLSPRILFLDLCFMLVPTASEFVTAILQDFKSIDADGFCLLKHLQQLFSSKQQTSVNRKSLETFTAFPLRTKAL